MAVLCETKAGNSRIDATQLSTTSGFLMSLSSGEIWTLGLNASAGPTRCQRAIHSLLARARYATEDVESVYGSLAGIAARAHALRDVEAVEIASEIMLGLPVSTHAKNIAHYYQAFCLNERREFDAARETADQLLEEGLSSRLRSRVLLIKGFSYSCAGQIEQSLPFYLEAGRTARNSDIAASLRSIRNVAVIKSIHGDHDEAAADLESLLPLAWRISRHDPEAYAATLNSYAVELAELGHVEQALNVVSRVRAFSSVVPEISETITELKSKLPTRKRSVVVIHRPTESLAARRANPNPANHHSGALVAWIISTAARGLTSYRALPAPSVRFGATITARNPAREPTKPRAP